MTNNILEYYQAIQDGSIVVGKWIKIWYEKIVHGIEDKTYCFDIKRANKAIKFIETLCHHCEGRSDLIKLELWQKALVSVLFGILDANGNRQFREAVVIMGRKNGKTLFASAIIAYMAYLDGEYGAKVYCLAPKLEQANIVYDNFYQMLRKEPDLNDLAKKRRSDIYISESNTSVKPVAFNAKKSDGFNPQLVVCDEIASWQGDQGLKQYEVMKSALGARRQPLMLSISTAGYVNEGIYDELIKRSTRFLLGDSKEQRLAPFLYMIDDPSKWSDLNELRKSNPNLGVSVSIDYMLEEIAVAEGSLSKKAEFLTKYCNIKQNSSQAWLSTQAVNKASGEHFDLSDFRSSYAVCGIDLSRTTDLTAVTCVIQRSGELYCFAHFFLPSERIEEATMEDGLPYNAYIQRGLLTPSGSNFVDYEDCYNWLTRLIQEYEIYPLKVGYDRYNALQLTQKCQTYGMHMDDVFQGYNLTPVIHEFEGLIKDGKIHIGDNDLLKVHLLNAALKTETETDRVKLVKMSARDHIDGCAALLDAFTVRQKWWNEIGSQLENEEG